MELVLNLAWVVLAAVMAALWVRFRPRDGFSHAVQLIALLSLVMILFPVISVSDDLQTLQNPAEADCCMRRDHVVASAHSILPPVIALFHAITAQFPASTIPLTALVNQPLRVAQRQQMAAIDRRPPPAA